MCVAPAFLGVSAGPGGVWGVRNGGGPRLHHKGRAQRSHGTRTGSAVVLCAGIDLTDTAHKSHLNLIGFYHAKPRPHTGGCGQRAACCAPPNTPLQHHHTITGPPCGSTCPFSHLEVQPPPPPHPHAHHPRHSHTVVWMPCLTHKHTTHTTARTACVGVQADNAYPWGSQCAHGVCTCSWCPGGCHALCVRHMGKMPVWAEIQMVIPPPPPTHRQTTPLTDNTDNTVGRQHCRQTTQSPAHALARPPLPCWQPAATRYLLPLLPLLRAYLQQVRRYAHNKGSKGPMRAKALAAWRRKGSAAAPAQ